VKETNRERPRPDVTQGGSLNLLVDDARVNYRRKGGQPIIEGGCDRILAIGIRHPDATGMCLHFLLAN